MKYSTILCAITQSPIRCLQTKQHYLVQYLAKNNIRLLKLNNQMQKTLIKHIPSEMLKVSTDR